MRRTGNVYTITIAALFDTFNPGETYPIARADIPVNAQLQWFPGTLQSGDNTRIVPGTSRVSIGEGVIWGVIANASEQPTYIRTSFSFVL